MKARRIRYLLSIIDQLPSNSHYAAAVANDDAAAEYHLAMNPNREPQKPQMPLTHWTPEVAELRTIAERLATLTSALVGNRVKFQQLPRPEIATDRLKYRQAVAQHQVLVAVLLPPAPPQEV